MARQVDLSDVALSKMNLSPETREILRELKAEMDAAYRAQISDMASALNRQAMALDRIQKTLHILVRHIEPSLKDTIPPVLRVAPSSEQADLASAVVLADPVAAGFTLSQSNIAEALGLSAPDVSVLIRAFKLNSDADHAVTVRQGKRKIVNYRASVIERFRSLILMPPDDFPEKHRKRLNRAALRISSGQAD